MQWSKEKIKVIAGLVAATVSVTSMAAVGTIRENTEIDYNYKGAIHKIKLVIIRDERKPTDTPYIVLNHGRLTDFLDSTDPILYFGTLSQYLVNYGFTVIIPVRVGYGHDREKVDIEEEISSDGKWCKNDSAAETMADEGRVINDYIRTLPYIDPARGIFSGHSYGGTMSIAVGGHNLQGIKGIVNMAGGMGGRLNQEPMCRNETSQLYQRYAKTSVVPELWIYGDQDERLKSSYRSWYDSFTKGGGVAQLVVFKGEGHGLGPAIKTLDVAKLIKQYAIERGVLNQ